MYYVNTGYLDEPHWEYTAEEVGEAHDEMKEKAFKAQELLDFISEAINHIKSSIEQSGIDAISDIGTYLEDLDSAYGEYDDTRREYEDAKDHYENMAENLYCA